MRMPIRIVVVFLAFLLVTAGAWAQREFRVYESFEREDSEMALPPDWDQPADFVVGRLMYPGGGGWRGGDWLRGGTPWTVDYPRGDRMLAELLRRFTWMDVRSVEQPVNLNDGDDVFFWPFLMVGLPGNWQLTQYQVEKLREYLLRGGFLFADSFFGSRDWVGFEAGLRRVFPDRPIIEVKDDHPVFHIVYDLAEVSRVQIPNMNSLMRGGGGWLSDGRVPQWRGIEDDHGRLMVLVAFNNDVADSWQWADDPRYPSESASYGLRLGVNIAVYTLPH
jgi:hypothetical protein